MDSKTLAQVNRIKDPTPKEIEEARNYDSDSNFVMCTFPKYDNGFGVQEKPLWSGYRRKKLPNPVSSTVLSFMKRPMKEGHYDTTKRCEIFCYTT